MRVVIGSDHAGFALKQTLIEHLRQNGHEIADVGSFDAQPVDFPDIAQALTHRIVAGEAARGIMVCGTGVGASIAANKVRGIRAAVLHDWHCAHQAVEHDDVNVMCLGAQIVGAWLACDLIDAFLAAEFSTDKDFRRRVAMLHEMEASQIGAAATLPASGDLEAVLDEAIRHADNPEAAADAGLPEAEPAGAEPSGSELPDSAGLAGEVERLLSSLEGHIRMLQGRLGQVRLRQDRPDAGAGAPITAAGSPDSPA